MIICWFHRKIISGSVDEVTALPDRTRKHVENCPNCRDIYESQMETARQLLAGAGSGKREPSPFLRARIMSSIAYSQLNAERKHERVWAGWAYGLATVCLLLTGVIWFRNQPTSDSSDFLAGFLSPSAAVPAGPEVPDAFVLLNGTQMRQWSAKLDEPLQTEMNLVVTNTKTAATALVNNFMPEELRDYLF